MPNIIRCSDFALERTLLSTDWRIHSVYRKTINLEFRGEIVSIQSQATPLSPLSLICDLSPSQMSYYGLNVGDPVRIGSGGIETDRCFFGFANADIVRLELPVITGADINKSEDRIIECLSNMMPSIGFSDFLLPDGREYLNNPAAVFADGILKKAKKKLLGHDCRGAAGQLCSLIGLGIGLTPSGDDFLCGFLSGLMMYNSPLSNAFFDILSSEIISGLKRTNDISAAFLKCAASGVFSEALCNFTQYNGSTDIYSAFSAIGHSSGADTLCGLLSAFKTMGIIQCSP